MRYFVADRLVVSWDRVLSPGVLGVDDRGVVRHVGRDLPGHATRRFRDAVIAPGFVNLHTHLDLSLLKVPPTDDWYEWVRRVIAYRRVATLDELAEAVRTGVRQCVQTGTVAVGDITTVGLTPRLWYPLHGVLFGELLGISEERVARVRDVARRWATAVEALAPRCGLRITLSPHAPYSTAAELYEWASTATTDHVLATHWLELSEEIDLQPSAETQPLRRLLEELGVWIPDRLWKPEELASFFVRSGRHWVVAHANYAPDLVTSCQPAITVAYCPRTHQRFHRAEHPLRHLLEAGVQVAIATDSLATAPDLNLLSEARQAVRLHGLSPAEAFRMVTEVPAQALRLHKHGRLQPGYGAHFVVLTPGSWTEDVFGDLLHEATRPVATFIGGEPAWEL